MEYKKRRLEPLLKRALCQFPITLLTGPRQAGKSTLLRHALSDFDYVTFDDYEARQQAKEDPKLFLDRYQPPIIFDEIQYVPELLSAIKMRVDERRHEYGQYVLTGSQIFQLMKGVSESLAGRVALFHVYPFSWEELEEAAHFPDQLIKGFYPEPALYGKDVNLWQSSYLATYIDRDLPQILSIGDRSEFHTFVKILATRVGQLINYSDLAKACSITVPTVKRWLSVLEASYIIRILHPYYTNRGKRLVKSPKVYFIDTGVLCHLLKIHSTDQLLSGIDIGHIFENMVIMEVIKRLGYTDVGAESYFYRSASGVEVDLLVLSEHRKMAYEIKYAKTLKSRMVAQLERFCKDHPEFSAELLSLNEKTGPFTEHVITRPWHQVLL